jgi:hypothetical protein
VNEELIQKLVDQCVDKRERYGRTVEVLQSRKFAELIVRECMEQVWYTREDGINGNVSEVIKDRMKQHFGVEE